MLSAQVEESITWFAPEHVRNYFYYFQRQSSKFSGGTRANSGARKRSGKTRREAPRQRKEHLNPCRSFGMSVWWRVYLRPLTARTRAVTPKIEWCKRARVHTLSRAHRCCYPLIFRYDVTRVFVKATARENFLISLLRRMYSREITEIRHYGACAWYTPIADPSSGGQEPVFIFNADRWFNVEQLTLIFI